jgi:hypothetical protein
MSGVISLPSFYELMTSHDWHYDEEGKYDPKTYRANKERNYLILAMAKLSNANQELYNQFHEWQFQGGPAPIPPKTHAEPTEKDDEL